MERSCWGLRIFSSQIFETSWNKWATVKNDSATGHFDFATQWRRNLWVQGPKIRRWTRSINSLQIPPTQLAEIILEGKRLKTSRRDHAKVWRFTTYYTVQIKVRQETLLRNFLENSCWKNLSGYSNIVKNISRCPWPKRKFPLQQTKSWTRSFQLRLVFIVLGGERWL